MSVALFFIKGRIRDDEITVRDLEAELPKARKVAEYLLELIEAVSQADKARRHVQAVAGKVGRAVEGTFELDEYLSARDVSVTSGEVDLDDEELKRDLVKAQKSVDAWIDAVTSKRAELLALQQEVERAAEDE